MTRRPPAERGTDQNGNRQKRNVFSTSTVGKSTYMYSTSTVQCRFLGRTEYTPMTYLHSTVWMQDYNLAGWHILSLPSSEWREDR